MAEDYLLRNLAAGGTADYLGRAVSGGVDYLGREVVAAWSASTAYQMGDHVELSTGPVLRVVVAGTSGASEPTAPGYGQTVVDGTVTWRQVDTG